MLTREEEIAIKAAAIASEHANPNRTDSSPDKIASQAERQVQAMEKLEDGVIKPHTTCVASSVNGHANGRDR